MSSVANTVIVYKIKECFELKTIFALFIWTEFNCLRIMSYKKV
jgi:hypothetical protein